MIDMIESVEVDKGGKIWSPNKTSWWIIPAQCDNWKVERDSSEFGARDTLTTQREG